MKNNWFRRAAAMLVAWSMLFDCLGAGFAESVSTPTDLQAETTCNHVVNCDDTTLTCTLCNQALSADDTYTVRHFVGNSSVGCWDTCSCGKTGSELTDWLAANGIELRHNAT